MLNMRHWFVAGVCLTALLSATKSYGEGLLGDGIQAEENFGAHWPSEGSSFVPYGGVAPTVNYRVPSYSYQPSQPAPQFERAPAVSEGPVTNYGTPAPTIYSVPSGPVYRLQPTPQPQYVQPVQNYYVPRAQQTFTISAPCPRGSICR